MTRKKPLRRDWEWDRKIKRQFRKNGIDNPVEVAFYEGQAGCIRHYPPGTRRDNYLAGKHISEEN